MINAVFFVKSKFKFLHKFKTVFLDFPKASHNQLCNQVLILLFIFH